MKNTIKHRRTSKKRGECQKSTRKQRSFCASPKNGEDLLGKLVKHQEMEKNHQVLEKNREYHVPVFMFMSFYLTAGTIVAGGKA